ncbi:hypothetical protein [Marinomonas transparens]|uniref:Uncharacterized protein n=1 Tax=Marinomonas transparens TaxID=2795388 RepID=A0A934JXN7_9GAMM|nr:hypothetical protein [Marinomonas transparens]MBJ7539104.1 hypothetical protein [Marinomonas transparens]
MTYSLPLLRGSLLLELLVAILLLSLILPFVVTATARLHERYQLAQTYLEQHKVKNAIEEHFRSQWSRLVPANCCDDETLFLTIQSGHSVPSRLSKRPLSAQSDWLKGSDYGLCRTSVTITTNPLETGLSCHWKAGNRVSFSSCDARYQGQVLSVSSSRTKIELMDEAALGQSGILASEDAFYWYLGEGKNGQNALWRTPEGSGNSLELWAGLERLSIFPLLDNDKDGLVDAIDSRYGDFSLQTLRGLWVEYLYELSDCAINPNAKQAPQRNREYRSMRGDTWHYQAPCQGVGNHIIVLKGKSL